jgi:FdhE protein
VTLDGWIKSHPYLGDVARVRQQIDEAVAAAPPAVPADWHEYAEDFIIGVPILLSDARVDLHLAGRAVMTTFDSLSIDAPGATPDGIVEWLLGDDAWQPKDGGLLRTVGWISLAASLRPLVHVLNAWRDEDKWLRRYCPCCGSLPAMAQLAGDDPARMRLLTCGRCATQWRYGRTMCPFCESDDQKLTTLAIEGESGLRVDYCESCKGYLKTYAGQGDEGVLLADWTSLHLDHLALARGLKRKATSLYEMSTEPGFATGDTIVAAAASD